MNYYYYLDLFNEFSDIEIFDILTIKFRKIKI